MILDCIEITLNTLKNLFLTVGNGTLYAKQELSGIICGGLRAVFLVLPLCHWNMQLANEDEVPIISKLFEQ